jgi:hypothetical protein
VKRPDTGNVSEPVDLKVVSSLSGAARFSARLPDIAIDLGYHASKRGRHVSVLEVFTLGMVGALAPEIVRLYTIRSHPGEFTWSATYLVASALFAGLGGVVAFALPATTAWGALYAGISTPTLVTAALKKARSARSKPETKAPPKLPARQGLGAFLNAL